MRAEDRSLLRNQLDRQLGAPLRSAPSGPQRGFVRAVREALGMNGRQLAERMGVARSQLSQLEDAEVRGTTSLRTLARAAGAMDCNLVYVLVPREGRSFEEIVQERARRVATRIVEDVAASMALEDQAVDEAFRKREIDRVTAELVRTTGRDLWDD